MASWWLKTNQTLLLTKKLVNICPDADVNNATKSNGKYSTEYFSIGEFDSKDFFPVEFQLKVVYKEMLCLSFSCGDSLLVYEDPV